jgi:hypothetical protein
LQTDKPTKPSCPICTNMAMRNGQPCRLRLRQAAAAMQQKQNLPTKNSNRQSLVLNSHSTKMTSHIYSFGHLLLLIEAKNLYYNYLARRATNMPEKCLHRLIVGKMARYGGRKSLPHFTSLQRILALQIHLKKNPKTEILHFITCIVRLKRFCLLLLNSMINTDIHSCTMPFEIPHH